MLSTPDLDRLGNLVSTIGSREFGGSFYTLFRDMFDIEECTVFAFPAPSQPQPIVIECASDETRNVALRLADDYVSGGYLTDPNVLGHAQPCSTANIYVTNPDDIDDASYRAHYYEKPSISQELVVMGHAGGTLYYTSLYRKSCRSAFGHGELSAIRPLANFIVKTLHRHSELVTPQGESNFSFVPCPTDAPSELRQRTLQHLREVLLAGDSKLSQREAEICAGIVMGYSTLAIALNCAISTNTVATHRKRAYAKLGISSQNELFVRYFSTVRDFQARQTH